MQTQGCLLTEIPLIGSWRMTVKIYNQQLYSILILSETVKLKNQVLSSEGHWRDQLVSYYTSYPIWLNKLNIQLFALVISSAAFHEIFSANKFSLKLFRSEVWIFLSLLIDTFPFLDQLKDPLLVESKSVLLLTSEEDVYTKTEVTS